jgi:predicted Zn-dependent protease
MISLKRRGVRGVSALLIVLLEACDISASDEKAMGDAYAASIRQQLQVTEDPRLVESLARRIAVASGAETRDWRYYVVDDTIVNAFAVPGGHIFVFRGLLERTASSAEVAGVLGHEIAHVVLRHSVDQLKKQQRANILVTLFCWATGACESAVAQVAIGLGGQALFAKHSRDDERQADSAAVEYLMRAGIDPQGIPDLFRRLLQARRSNPTEVESWFGTHPLEEDRIARTEALIKARREAGDGGREKSRF